MNYLMMETIIEHCYMCHSVTLMEVKRWMHAHIFKNSFSLKHILIKIVLCL